MIQLKKKQQPTMMSFSFHFIVFVQNYVKKENYTES